MNLIWVSTTPLTIWEERIWFLQVIRDNFGSDRPPFTRVSPPTPVQSAGSTFSSAAGLCVSGFMHGLLLVRQCLALGTVSAAGQLVCQGCTAPRSQMPESLPLPTQGSPGNPVPSHFSSSTSLQWNSLHLPLRVILRVKREGKMQCNCLNIQAQHHGLRASTTIRPLSASNSPAHSQNRMQGTGTALGLTGGQEGRLTMHLLGDTRGLSPILSHQILLTKLPQRCHCAPLNVEEMEALRAII